MEALAPADPPCDVLPDRSSARRVLVLQGGGALGAYQAGVYEALAAEERGLDWVTGISIGAINAALIAGNAPEQRVERLRAFWTEVSSGPTPSLLSAPDQARSWLNGLSAGLIATFGAPGFFRPRWPSPLLSTPGTPEAISWYDTSPLRATLERLVDFDRLNGGETRLSVGAVNVLTGNTMVFDTARQRVGPEHIMASGALPPGFAPVVIDGQPYWDGGLVSNTPLQFVLDEDSGEPLLVMQVDLFPAQGELPKTLQEADEREKDIRYSSRTRMNTDAAKREHKAREALRIMLKRLPPDLADDPEVELVRQLARENAVTIVQLIYRKRVYEGGIKDFEFSRQTMRDHWAAGRTDAERAVQRYRGRLHTPEPGIVVLDPGKPDPAEEPKT